MRTAHNIVTAQFFGAQDKPRHGFLYIYAEYSRLCPEISPKALLEPQTEGEGRQSLDSVQDNPLFLLCLALTHNFLPTARLVFALPASASGIPPGHPMTVQ